MVNSQKFLFVYQKKIEHSCEVHGYQESVATHYIPSLRVTSMSFVDVKMNTLAMNMRLLIAMLSGRPKFAGKGQFINTERASNDSSRA